MNNPEKLASNGHTRWRQMCVGHHYTQMQLRKIMFKQWWSKILKSTKQKTTSQLKPLDTKRTQHMALEKLGHGLGQAQKCGRVRSLNGSEIVRWTDYS